jgi:peroxiredoxin
MKFSLFIFTLIISSTIQAQNATSILHVGDLAPQFMGMDQTGKNINSEDILKENKILLVFYRGNWCPHCKKHLGSLQEHLNAFRTKGVFVVVVTPETLEKTIETAEKFKTDFSIVHDPNNKIMTDFNVIFEVNQENVPNYYKIVAERVKENNGNNNVLPIPATFLMDTNGKIIYAQYDTDYKNRSDFDEILSLL